MENLIYYLLGIGILGISYTSWKYFTLMKKDEGTQHAKNVSSYINSASLSYVKTSYKVLGVFVVLLAVLLFLQDKYALGLNGLNVISFASGAVLSAVAGFISVHFSSKLHARTAVSAENTDSGFKTTFTGGMASGIAYTSVLITGAVFLFIMYRTLGTEQGLSQTVNLITAYILGASVVGLFDRLIGGVFAEGLKSAKKETLKSEEAIPEYTAVNPAEIAHAAGVNVNNTSGASSDMTGSYIAVLVAAFLLGISFTESEAINAYFAAGPVLLPLSILGIGILSALTGSFFVKSISNNSFWTTYRFAYYFSVGLTALASFFVIKFILPLQWNVSQETIDGIIVSTKYKSLGIFWTVFIGMAAGVLINFSTEYFTISGKPVNKLIENTFKSSSASYLSGTSRGFLATAVPVLIILTTLSGAYYFADFYGMAMSAIGFLSVLSIVLAINTGQPISENANTLAKMSLMPDEIIYNTQELADYTMKKEKYVKSLAVSAAGFAGIVLLSAFFQQTGISSFELSSPWTISFMIIGGLMPFLFSSTVIDSVNKVSEKASEEIKRQFEEIPELKAAFDIFKKYFGDPDVPTQGEQNIINAAEGKAEYDDLVIISTFTAIKTLIIPIVLAIAIPVLSGYFLGAQALTGLLTGIIPVSFILAFTQVNSGTSWNSVKKELEAGVIWNGEKYDKNSAAYEMAKQADEVGSVYRNASAPALNLLIKISIIVALMIAFIV